MSKHTPGPWIFVVQDGDRKIIANNHATMCDMSYYPWCPDNDEDWELIAAAPDLLEALKEMALEYGMTDKARAAIAKATGEA